MHANPVLAFLQSGGEDYIRRNYEDKIPMLAFGFQPGNPLRELIVNGQLGQDMLDAAYDELKTRYPYLAYIETRVTPSPAIFLYVDSD